MINLHIFDNAPAQASALAQATGDALNAVLAARASARSATHARRATLAVSGGTSPRLFFTTLSTLALDWSQIDITLVDERWVAQTSPASNARLVREALLQHNAAHARFLPLVDVDMEAEVNVNPDVNINADAPPETRVAALNADAQRPLPDIAVLGMGEDGHTASLFANAPEWPQAITTTQPFIAMHPREAPHARVSLSFAALRRISRLFLLIAGKRKLDVLQQAAASAQPNAISALAHDAGVKLDVYWCAG